MKSEIQMPEVRKKSEARNPNPRSEERSCSEEKSSSSSFSSFVLDLGLGEDLRRYIWQALRSGFEILSGFGLRTSDFPSFLSDFVKTSGLIGATTPFVAAASRGRLALRLGPRLVPQAQQPDIGIRPSDFTTPPITNRPNNNHRKHTNNHPFLKPNAHFRL